MRGSDQRRSSVRSECDVHEHAGIGPGAGDNPLHHRNRCGLLLLQAAAQRIFNHASTVTPARSRLDVNRTGRRRRPANPAAIGSACGAADRPPGAGGTCLFASGFPIVTGGPLRARPRPSGLRLANFSPSPVTVWKRRRGEELPPFQRATNGKLYRSRQLTYDQKHKRDKRIRLALGRG